MGRRKSKSRMIAPGRKSKLSSMRAVSCSLDNLPVPKVSTLMLSGLAGLFMTAKRKSKVDVL